MDYEKLALLAGYKSAASASVSLGNIKKKLNIKPDGAAQGSPGPATLKGSGTEKVGSDEVGTSAHEVTATISKKRGRKPKTEIEPDSAPAPKKRATEGHVIGLASEAPKKRGRKPKEPAAPQPNPVENNDAKFWSTDETPSERSNSLFADILDDSSYIIKEEVADDDHPMDSNDVEAAGAHQAQSNAELELNWVNPSMSEN